jgi:hypothetical protein
MELPKYVEVAPDHFKAIESLTVGQLRQALKIEKEHDRVVVLKKLQRLLPRGVTDDTLVLMVVIDPEGGMQ